MTGDRGGSAALGSVPPVAVPPVAVPYPVRLVPMRRRHLRGVLAIEELVNHRPWSLELFAGELRMPTSRWYAVALAGAEVVGFAGWMLAAPDEAHVTNVGVHPAVQRRGVGRRLMLELAEEAVARGVEAMTLEVRLSNDGAQRLYRDLGFVPGGVRPNYYADLGEDALIMWAHDLQSPEYADRLDRLAGAAGVTRRGRS